MRKMSIHRTQSYWMQRSPNTTYPSLTDSNASLHVDVAVIGAGIAGLTAAVKLKLAGKTVAVLDQHHVASGETGHTTAHITEILDTGYRKIRRHFGRRGARLVAEACRSANDQIAQWINHWNLKCDYERVPAYLYAESPMDTRHLKTELNACQKVGIHAKWESSAPLPFNTYGAILLEDQAQFHPRKYSLALAQRVFGQGSYVFEKTHVLEITDGNPCRITTKHGEVLCEDLIVATNVPISNRSFLITKVAAYRTYALAARLTDPPEVRGLFWDAANPYHYTRSYQDAWIIGGEDHKTGMKKDTHDSFQNLIEYVHSHFGMSGILSTWSGQIMEPVDGLPYIGLNSASRHTYVATGFSGNGMTFGTLSGMLISDLILKQDNPFQDIFEATRIKPISSISRFVSENKDYPLCLIEDHFLSRNMGTFESINQLPEEEGSVVTQDGNEIAVYRDQSGELHAVSAICPHLGCQVHWNSAEKSWDCPCHGSRFSSNGEVLNGPATRGLKSISLQEQTSRKKTGRAA